MHFSFLKGDSTSNLSFANYAHSVRKTCVFQNSTTSQNHDDHVGSQSLEITAESPPACEKDPSDETGGSFQTRIGTVQDPDQQEVHTEDGASLLSTPLRLKAENLCGRGRRWNRQAAS